MKNKLERNFMIFEKQVTEIKLLIRWWLVIEYIAKVKIIIGHTWSSMVIETFSRISNHSYKLVVSFNNIINKITNIES